MKTMKVALLATAALAAVSVSARADDTAAIKAQLEALTARIAQLEAAPAVPMGYSLLTVNQAQATVIPGLENFDRGYGDTATVIGIMPTADMPATTTIEWSGYVRAIVALTDYGYAGGGDDVNVWTRGQLNVTGKTDTAVGEVGATLKLRADAHGVDNDPRWFANEYWGWWAMTPEITFGGGYSGSLGNIGYGVDGACNCYGTDWFTAEQRDEDNISVATNPGDTTQMRLSWASGPVSAAIAVEDSDYDGGSGDMGGAAEIKYSGDTVSGEISGMVYEHNDGGNTAQVLGDNPATTVTVESDFIVTPAVTTAKDGTGWQVGAGMGFALGGMANLSMAASLGKEPSKGDYWNASALINFNLSDSVHAETGVSYADYSDLNVNLWEGIAGIYYDPVSQLTLGLEADYADGDLDTFYGGPNSDFLTVDFVTVWRF